MSSPSLQSTTLKRVLNIAIVDDDQVSVFPLLTLLKGLSHSVCHLSSGEQLLEELKQQCFDYIFLDSQMPGLSGEDTLLVGDSLLSLKSKIPVTFYSGSINAIKMPERLKNFQIDGFLEKGDHHQLLSFVQNHFGNTLSMPEASYAP